MIKKKFILQIKKEKFHICNKKKLFFYFFLRITKNTQDNFDETVANKKCSNCNVILGFLDKKIQCSSCSLFTCLNCSKYEVKIIN